MNTNRRNFLIKAVLTASEVAFISTTKGMSAISYFSNQNQFNTDPPLEDGWLNVRNCGASGSKFETIASVTKGTRQITVANVGDFKVGQGIMVSKCNIHYEPTQLWGTGLPYYNKKPLENSVEVRGFNGSAGSWVVYVLDIEPSSSPAFRWTDDLGHTWHPNVPNTHDWQLLSSGVEVRLNQRDWDSGYVVAFGARDQLISRIEKIEGNVLTLQHGVNTTVDNAVVRHNDTFAIQEAIDYALKEKLKVYVPVGHYRLAQTIRVNNAHAITIEGASAVDTIFDISDGEGACFSLVGGTEVTIRNFSMIGFMGFGERDKAGYLNTRGSTYIWGFQLKHCNAISISDTERVLVENCHASRMSGECFVSGGHSRAAVKPGQSYSKGITYMRCSVTDSARNAFNDVMCGTENTSVLNCRIVDVGGCAWEGASRFVKFTGNYIRNAGTVAMGNLGPANRDNTYPGLGAGQHLIADNVFENNVSYGACAIRSRSGATQVIIRNNTFINFGSSAIEASGDTDATHFSSGDTTITGNILDLTCFGQQSLSRTAINISANDTIVSDNQIYVRGPVDPMVTAIRLHEPALNVNVHDNLIRNCGVAIASERGESTVSKVVDNQTFLRSNSPSGLPQDRIHPAMCRGWSLVWRSSIGTQSLADISVIDSFDPETLCFKLTKPHTMKPGDSFEVIAPSLNWDIHDNTITGCLRPVVLNSYGSNTSLFKDNLVSRGSAIDVLRGIEVHGCFQFLNNHLIGFDEWKAAALSLYPDAIGRVCTSQYQANIFENCFYVITENQPGLWKSSMIRDNLAIKCIHKIPR